MEENADAFLVVAESYCRYKAPAYYDDELIVRTHITELRRRSLRFGYEIVRASDGRLLPKEKLVMSLPTRTVGYAHFQKDTHKDC
jgi:YbgC/YbaW family acyl-CoA thioester hydrolase